MELPRIKTENTNRHFLTNYRPMHILFILSQNFLEQNAIPGKIKWAKFPFHPYYLISGPAVAVSADAHVHYVEGVTAMVDGHTHQVELTTFQLETE